MLSDSMPVENQQLFEPSSQPTISQYTKPLPLNTTYHTLSP